MMDPTVWPVVLPLFRDIAKVLAELGVPVQSFLAGSALTEAELNQSDKAIPYGDAVVLLQRAVAASPRLDLGIEVALRQQPSSWGILGYAVICSATIHEALRIGQSYHRVSSSINRLRLEVDDRQARWIAEPARPLGEALRFAVEQEFVPEFRAMETLTGREVRLLGARFQYPAPGYVERYEEIFRCPLTFGAERNELVLDLATLELPLLQANPVSAAIARRLCEDFLALHPLTDDLIMDVRFRLLRVSGEFPDEDEVARQMNVSTRTLRNRLARVGTSYLAIRHDVRAQLARDYLTGTRLKVDDIAARLGFSDARAFRRAFVSWTGLAPRDFRLNASPADAGGSGNSLGG